MLDIQFIRDNKDAVAVAAQHKNIDLDLDKLLELDDERKNLQQHIDELRTQRNAIAQALQDASQRTPEVMETGKRLKAEITALEEDQRQIMEAFFELMLKVPNIPSADTPIGKDDSENVEIKKQGDLPSFDFEIQDHVALGTSLDILDLEKGVAISGFRGYFLKNEGAQMHMAVLQYVFNKLIGKGFTPMTAPAIVREEPLLNMGQFPGHREETYRLVAKEGEEDKYLAGTAEVGLLSYFADEVLEGTQLPIKLCGFSPCYRSEAGSHGKDTKGLYRVHEFMKIEQLVIAENNVEASLKLHEELLAISEEILQDLGLPYRVIITCTGDQGQGKHKMYDVETWMPSREKYGETHSNSLLTDWQARRANIRYKDTEGIHFAHTLNNTAIASPRILIALWENYQQADGSIRIPEALVPYMGGKTVITRK